MSYNLDTASSSLHNLLSSIDWSFPNLSNTGLHALHWYPATYLSAIPGTLIPHLAGATAVVLDPFCGSGTSGAEAIRLGRSFIGIDNNPVALLISEAKLTFPSPIAAKKALAAILRESQGMFGTRKPIEHPNQGELLGWYHPQTFDSLNRLLWSIISLDDLLIRRAFLAVYSSLLKNCSSQGRHWGWVCDNVKPRPEEFIYKDAFTLFCNAANEYIKTSELAYNAAQVYSPGITRRSIRARSKLLLGDCIAQLANLEDASIDLIVTSPPYYGVADYVKSQRLTYLWLDLDELSQDRLGYRDFEMLRSTEIGARSNRHRSDSHERYLVFMKQFFAQCVRVLRIGAPMTLVIGESASRAGTLEELIRAAHEVGFELAFRSSRDIRTSRRRLMAKVKGEDVLLFRVRTM